MKSEYAVQPLPSIPLEGIDGMALNGRSRSSRREDGMFGILALFAFIVTIAAAWTYRCARRELAARLAHEFAYILDAIDEATAVGGELAFGNGDKLPQSGSLMPVAPASPTATWPFLLGSRRTAVVTSFLEAALALDGLDKKKQELSLGDSTRIDPAFAGNAQLVTTLGDQALLSLRDVLSHPRGRAHTTRA
jgi:hypothetical protein